MYYLVVNFSQIKTDLNKYNSLFSLRVYKVLESYVCFIWKERQRSDIIIFADRRNISSDGPDFQFDIWVIGGNIPKFSGKYLFVKRLKRKNRQNKIKNWQFFSCEHSHVFNIKMGKYRKSMVKIDWKKERLALG